MFLDPPVLLDPPVPQVPLALPLLFPDLPVPQAPLAAPAQLALLDPQDLLVLHRQLPDLRDPQEAPDPQDLLVLQEPQEAPDPLALLAPPVLQAPLALPRLLLSAQPQPVLHR